MWDNLLSLSNEKSKLVHNKEVHEKTILKIYFYK